MDNKPNINAGTKIWLHWRAGLCASTALSAVLVSPVPARAQISPTATPQGGVVVGGNATIIQAPASTTINQSSQRAAINFQSFNVGSAASVQINQPNANSVELDRVVGGNLSQINGQINSNGQVVLINQSGVVFGKGAQVNAENVVVSTSNIATADFMNGHMVFAGPPNPGAKIINDGHITARQAGLVGLVAPQVENNGVITATLGQVVLAGASAFTLDMYGDRLISLDVTKAVQAVDVGGKLVPALVTNSGLILADGGKITLSAQDADALVTQLINAGGTMRANSLGTHTGTISIQGVGGDISIAGNLLAQGQGGNHGGNIQALTTGTVAVAANAVVDASGDTGGGVIALGTDFARAATGASDTAAPKAASVVVAPGAILRADATASGNGGKVTLLSRQNTNFAGTISVTGGPVGGNGGTAEISSDNLISLGGSVADTAPHGQAGAVLLDPATLIVAANGTVTAGSFGVLGDVTYGTDNSTVSYISPTVLDSLSGTIVLDASTLVAVLDAVSIASPNTSLSLVSGGDVAIDNAISVNGSLEIDAASSLNIAGSLTATDIALTSGAAGTQINSGVTAASGNVTLGSTGTVSEGPSGFIKAANLYSQGSIGGDVLLTGPNVLTTLDDFSAANLVLNNNGGLTLGRSVSAGNVSLSAASLTFEGNVSAKALLALTSTGTIYQGAGIISAGTLTGSADGLFALNRSANTIGTLGVIAASGGDFALKDTASLNVAGNVTGGDIYLTAPTLALNAPLTATNGAHATLAIGADDISAAGGSFSVAHGTLELAPLSFGGVDINGTMANALDITGAVLAAFDTSAAMVEIGNGAAGAKANAISIDGPVSFANGPLVDLSTSGTISDNAGTLSAGTLAFNAAGFTQRAAAALDVTRLQSDAPISGNILLSGPTNAIGTIGNLVAGGTINFTDSANLDIAGGVTASSIFLSVSPGNGVSLAAPQVTLDATGNAGVLALTADDISGPATKGAIQAANGTIIIAPATASRAITVTQETSAGTGLVLGPAFLTAVSGGEQVLQIGKANITGDIVLGQDANDDLSIPASLRLVSQSSAVTNGTLTVGTLTFDTQSLLQNSGVIAASLITGTASGSVSLAGPGNQITELGSLAVGPAGTLDLADTGRLDVTGPVVGLVVSLSSDTIDLAGNISAPEQLALGSSGSITQTAGSLTTGQLTSDGSIGGDVLLTAANTIANLSAFTLGGTLDLADTGLLTVTGPVNGLVVSLSSGTMNLAGNISTPTELDLGSTGNIIQTAGSLTAGTLASEGSIGGDVILTAGNSIGTLSAFTLGGTLDLADTGLLTVTGPVAGPIVSLTSDTIDLAGNITAPSEVALGSTGSITQTAGSLTTAHLISEGSIGGDVIFQAANVIADLSAFTIGGTLDLADTGRLDVTGPVSGSTVTLASDTIDLAGNIFAPNQLALGSAGTIIQTSGTLTTGQLTSAGSIGGNVILIAANRIGTLSAFTLGGTLDLTDTGLLSVTGPVAGPIVSLTSDTIDFAGDIFAPDQLALGSSGSIVQSAGSITTGQLTSAQKIGGNVILTAANSIASLSAFTLGGTLDLANTGLLIVSGPVSGQAVSLASDTIDLAGDISAPIELALGGTGSIAQTAGSLTTGTLSSEGSIGGNVILTAANNIASLSAFTLGGILDLVDTGQITVTGPVTGPVISLASDTIDLAGNISASDQVALGSTGSITQSAGSITTGELTSEGSIGGNVILTAANSIVSLSAFTLGGTLDLANTGLLTVTGPIFGPVVSLSSDTINLAGNITAPDQLALGSTGSIAQTAGSITAGQLTSEQKIGGNVILTAGNSIASLSAFTLGGTLDLGDTGLLTITGPVSGPVISLASGTIDLAGNIMAGSVLGLAAYTAGISQTAGVIAAPTLTSANQTIAGSTDLIGSNNHIGTIGAFNSTGDVILGNGISLALAGPITATNATLVAPSLSVAGVLHIPGTLIFAGAAGVSETSAGQIQTADFSTGPSSINGNIDLNGQGNSIAILGSIAGTGGFTLNDDIALSLTAPVALGGTLALLDPASITQIGGTISAAALTSDQGTIGGNVALDQPGNDIPALGNFAAAGVVSLNDDSALNLAGDITAAAISLTSFGALTQSGIVTTPVLSANAASIILQDANSIGTLGTIATGVLAVNGVTGLAGPIIARTATLTSQTGFSITGNASITNQLTLFAAGGISQSDGDVSAGTATFTTPGHFVQNAGTISAQIITITAGNEIFAGQIAAPTQLALGSTGTIIQTAGSIATGQLTSAGSIGGDVILTAADTISDLSAFTVGGTLELGNTGLLTVTGPVVGLVVSLSSDTINLAGNISAPEQLALGSTGSITQSAGSLATGHLISEGSIGGDVILTAANAISDLSAFTLGGTLDLANTGLLTVTGPVSGPIVSLSSDTIDLAGNIFAPDQLALGRSGGVTQTAGSLTTGQLTSEGSIGGNVILTAANSIASLSAFTLGGTLELGNTGLLTVTGPVVGPVISLSSDTIDLAGNISAPEQLALGSSGNITQTAGSLATGDLTSEGSIGGNVILTAANSIATLSAFTLGGTLGFADTGLLTVTGPVVGLGVSLSSDTINLASNISAPEQLALGSSGGITQSAGSLASGQLISEGSIGGDVILTAGNSIGTLSAFTLGGTLDLADTGLLTVTGPVAGPIVSLTSDTIDLAGNVSASDQLALSSTGGITQTAGSLTTAHLISEGSIGGDVILQAANVIADLSAFTIGGTLDLADTGRLDVTGSVSGSSVTLASDTIDLAGNIFAPDQLALGSAGTIIQASGTLTTSQLTSAGSIGGNVILTAANRIGTLSAFTLGGTLDLADTGLLTVTGPVAGPIVSLTSDTIDLAGNIFAPDQLALGSTGSITQSAGSITTGELTSEGSIGRNVILTANNSIALLSVFTLGGTLDLANTGLLIVSGPVSGQAVSLVSDTIDLAGDISAPIELALGGTGSIAQTAGSITTGTLSSEGSIGGNVILTAANNIASLSAFTLGGTLDLVDTGQITVTGPVTGPVISLASDTIDLAGNISASDQLALGSTGSITQSAGSITTGELTSEGSIGGNVILTAANSIASLSALTFGGTLDLADTGPLTITGRISGPLINLAADTIDIAGDIAASNQLSLNSTGDISQSAGAVITPVLFVTAGNNVSQTGGTIASDNATFAGHNFNLSGTSRIADTLQINATGSIVHDAGILTATTFTGSAPQLASFAADTDFATLGSFIMQDSFFALANAGPLTIIGPVVASAVDISAAGQITLQGTPNGGLFIKGSIAPDKQPAPRPGDSSITSTPGNNSPAAIIQTGNFQINTGTPASFYTNTPSQPATIFFTTSPSGTIQFAPYPDELDAPSVDIVVSAGPNGSIAGNINVKHLEIQTAQSVKLTGAINNVVGSAAAGNGSVFPSPKPQFQFNSCPIGSVNCTILPIDALPEGNPLDNFDVKTRKRKKLDRNVQLPGVATRDY